MINSIELRQKFLDFFLKEKHSIIKSSPLLPIGDSSLLFTTAGMLQFKSMFSGELELEYKRATSCQKCLRTTDLDYVGKTPRHNTFFEMLGNFSFGDYFKKEAIRLAWEFSTNVIKLDKNRIYISIYIDDDEAYKLWHKYIGIPKNKIVRLKDNFWGPVSNSGPCGPCTELYYDLGEETLKKNDDDKIDGNNNRYLEFWNLVFNQFNYTEKGEKLKLSNKGVDTGMGLERLSLIVQNVKSIYHTDLFKPLINEIEKLSKFSYNKNTELSYNIIVDHIRGITFALAENILPSNEGRGYVIRRLLRRIIRFAGLIEIKKSFIHQLILVVKKQMIEVYPELKLVDKQSTKIILKEEETFKSTLDLGMNYLEKLIFKIKKQKKQFITGEEAFKLYDSLGFPLEFTEEISNNEGLKVDIEKYNELLKKQKKQISKKNIKNDDNIIIHLKNIIPSSTNSTKYIGDKTNICESIVNLIINDNKIINEANKTNNSIYYISCDQSPFYSESGGQIGDTGFIKTYDFIGEIINTISIEKNYLSNITNPDSNELKENKHNKIILHVVKIKQGKIKIKEKLSLEVNSKRKKEIAKHHSSTHLLHYALRKIIGNNVRQLGSYVKEDRLRFDFSHFKALEENELNKIEELINQIIMNNEKTKIQITDKNIALKEGALAFFGDKYGKKVRTVSIGKSFEFCGGTHVYNSGEIGSFKIITETSVSNGVRRIEAIAGEKAIKFYANIYKEIKKIEKKLNVSFENINNKINKLVNHNNSLEKELNFVQKELIKSNSKNINKNLIKIKDINYLGLFLKDKDLKELRQINDIIKQQYSFKLINILISSKKNRIYYIITLSKDLNHKIKASNLIKIISKILKGNGGGKNLRAEGSAIITSNSNCMIKETFKTILNYLQSNIL